MRHEEAQMSAVRVALALQQQRPSASISTSTLGAVEAAVTPLQHRGRDPSPANTSHWKNLIPSLSPAPPQQNSRRRLFRVLKSLLLHHKGIVISLGILLI